MRVRTRVRVRVRVRSSVRVRAVYARYVPRGTKCARCLLYLKSRAGPQSMVFASAAWKMEHHRASRHFSRPIASAHSYAHVHARMCSKSRHLLRLVLPPVILKGHVEVKGVATLIKPNPQEGVVARRLIFHAEHKKSGAV